jgi:hypothetical protein
MEKTESGSCVLCGEPAVAAPRVFVRQERELDVPVLHRLALCFMHGESLRNGENNPQQIIYAWATRAYEDLYHNERLVLRPELHCLACNGSIDGGNPVGEEARCPSCGTMNGIGSALGHPVAVRVLVGSS